MKKTFLKSKYLGAAFLACFLVFGAIATSFSARSQDVPAGLQASIFLKIISYDRAIAKKGGDTFKALIVYDDKSAKNKAAVLSGFKMMEGKEAQGKTIVVEDAQYSSQDQIAGLIPETCGLFYIVSGTGEDAINNIIAAGNKKKIGVYAGSEDIVNKGAGVGLGIEDNKPKMVVNLTAAKNQGMDIPANVLRLAKVIN